MTLAVILLNISFILSTPPSTAAIAQTAPQSATPDKPADTTPAQGQESTQPQQNPPAPSPPSTSAPPSATPAHSPATPNRKPKSRLKKRVLPPNCVPAPEAGTPSTSSSPSNTTGAAPSITPADPAAAAGAPTSAPASATTSATTNCPPKKVIVRQGGTSEPSIQLAGGPTGAHERDTATQMLQSAEANLKKIAGSQLTSSQKDMVTQIRQFMDQSKTATTAGDIERARTLAWKAQLLSEELVNPPK
jgi:hypothetical protein